MFDPSSLRWCFVFGWSVIASFTGRFLRQELVVRLDDDRLEVENHGVQLLLRLALAALVAGVFWRTPREPLQFLQVLLRGRPEPCALSIS